MDELHCRLNQHKVHFSRWINHCCLHKASGWTLDFIFMALTECEVKCKIKREKTVRSQTFWWTGTYASPWRNFGNGPWSRVGRGGECVPQRGGRAGRGLQLLADSLVNLQATWTLTSFHTTIRNKNHLWLLQELGQSPPPCRGKRATARLGDCRPPCSSPRSRTWAAPAGTRQSSPCPTSPKMERSLEGETNNL